MAFSNKTLISFSALGLFTFLAFGSSDNPQRRAEREARRAEAMRAEVEAELEAKQANEVEKSADVTVTAGDAKPDAEEPRPSEPIPATQQAFCDAIAEAATAYSAASNDLIRSKVRSTRKAAVLKAVPNGTAKNWIDHEL